MSVNLDLFREKKGQFVPAAWLSPKKPAAAHKGVNLEKRSSGLFRAGIDFSHLGSVEDSIRDGERGEVGELPWGEWETFPYIIQHKGEQYVRLYPPSKTVYYVEDREVVKATYDMTPEHRRSFKRFTDWEAAKMAVQYFVNGVEVDRETFNGFLTPSDAKKRDTDAPCITVKVSNLVHLGETDPDKPRRRAA
jgi:hypothetical protein